MERNEIVDALQRIFREILLDEELVLTEGLAIDSIEEWNSLNNMQMMAEIEQEYGVKFGLRDIVSWQTIGDMVTSFQNKLQQK